jgi:hypothetical protein
MKVGASSCFDDDANSCGGLRDSARAIDDESADHGRTHVWGAESDRGNGLA